ncbi:hypothetical protein BHE74_00020569 [Ensete ventricosum]|nr:hypothetical protein BHE74_00020569 [Ensete ventricosum]
MEDAGMVVYLDFAGCELRSLLQHKPYLQRRPSILCNFHLPDVVADQRMPFRATQVLKTRRRRKKKTTKVRHVMQNATGATTKGKLTYDVIRVVGVERETRHGGSME